MDRASVRPPNLVRPFPARTHGGAGARTHTRARECLYVRQGKEVRQIKEWRGFAPSGLPSDLAANLDELNPNDKRHHLTLAKALSMQMLSGDSLILFAMADELGHVCMPSPCADGESGGQS